MNWLIKMEKWPYTIPKYCVLCGKYIYYNQEIDKVPIQGMRLEYVIVHKECAKNYWDNWKIT